ncbi:VOC family protein [Irregularibacter muris]|uniref:VOC family protein n=1 Tax=Irregularibacter muris TaxID=1796619 RepID=A0AAE3HIM5_9FIRM|nr:VOC family protein [Irregularibacter muris]MCR1900144.1 VOC family protein [Irregularibacter muris]
MVIPFITFNGECNKALEFYQNVFNSKVSMLQQYEEYIPEDIDTPPESLSSWILHAEMEICGTKFWFADDVSSVSKGNIVRLVITVSTAEEARKIFELLREEGHISLPPVETFYSTFHAALTDKFGVSWNIVAEESPDKN